MTDITCHPVLPLLLTTSHHNVVHRTDDVSATNTFCSELILWRVDPVGPLSKSGGITELARINSQEISAFSDVAWIPTLLPSSTLGSITNRHVAHVHLTQCKQTAVIFQKYQQSAITFQKCQETAVIFQKCPPTAYGFSKMSTNSCHFSKMSTNSNHLKK